MYVSNTNGRKSIMEKNTRGELKGLQLLLYGCDGSAGVCRCMDRKLSLPFIIWQCCAEYDVFIYFPFEREISKYATSQRLPDIIGRNFEAREPATSSSTCTTDEDFSSFDTIAHACTRLPPEHLCTFCRSSEKAVARMICQYELCQKCDARFYDHNRMNIGSHAKLVPYTIARMCVRHYVG